MPVKTASWRQRSEPPCRRPTMNPQMYLKPLTPLDQRTSQTRSLSLTARDPSQLMAQTVKHQRPLQPLQRNSVYILIVPLRLTESLRIKKTITVIGRRRAKRTTWSPQLLVPVTLSLIQTLEGTTVPHKLKVSELPRSAPPQPVKWRVLMIEVWEMPICNRPIAVKGGFSFVWDVCFFGGWRAVSLVCLGTW